MKVQRLINLLLATLIFFAVAASPLRAQEREFDIDACREAVRVRDGDPGAYYNLGGACYERGCYREAVENYKDAIRLNPNFPPARFWLGAAYLNLGDISSAKDEYKNLKDMDKDEAKRLKELIKSFEEGEKAKKKAEKEAEKARKKAEKEEMEEERRTVKAARKEEKERLKRKARILDIPVRQVQEQEFWEEYWDRYRRADTETRMMMRYQMDVYLKKREVEAQEETARAMREAAAAAFWNRSYRPYWSDPFYCW
ncbi:MAG: tetratricopeptide repeat protein [Candidatus Tritonobacter lacicola]|nr:tetratricopeptide repeat protein [Candidatus Tritonobacter lacicola]